MTFNYANLIRLTRGGIATPAPVPEPKLVYPGSAWNGASGTGFTVDSPVPVDPVTRETAKPTLHLIFSPGDRFASNYKIAVASFGHVPTAQVDLHVEGNVFSQTTPTVEQVSRPDGGIEKVWAFWFEIDHAACMALSPGGGTIKVRAKAISSDPTMQVRVSEDWLFYPGAVLYDKDLTVATSATEVIGSTYKTIAAAISYLRTQTSAHNNRITITESGVYALGYGGGVVANRLGHTTITAAPGISATIGGTTDTNSTTGVFRTGYDGLRFYGPGITIDAAFVRQIVWESGPQHILEGCNLTNSRGPAALSFGDTWLGIVGRRWVYFCQISNLIQTGAVNANSVCFNDFTQCAGDLTSNSGLVMGNRGITNSSGVLVRTKTPCLSVAYTGAGAATFAKNGGQNSPSSVVTLTDPAGSVDITTGQYTGFTAGAAGSMTWLAGLINARAGWSASVLVEPVSAFDYAANALGSASGSRGGPIAAFTVTSTPTVLYGAIEVHGDFFQIQVIPNVPRENYVVAFNRFAQGSSAAFLIADATSFADIVIAYNAIHMDNSMETFGSLMSKPCSHVVFSHNDMPNQSFGLSAAYVADAYCKITGNVFSRFTNAGNATAATIDGNHSIDGTVPANATNTTTGETMESLLPGAQDADFTPAGILVSSKVASFLPVDGQINPTQPMDARGAWRAS